MKRKLTVKQPSPDEIINSFLKDNPDIPIFKCDDYNSFLTEDGKAAMSIGISLFLAYKKKVKK